MGPDDRQHTVWALVVAVKERVRCLEESVQGGKELTRGHLTAALPPPHLNRVQPRAGGRQVQQDQPPGRGTDDRFDLISGMGIGVIPRDIDGARGMRVDQGLQPCGDLPATFAAAAEYAGFAGLVIDGAQALALVWLPWSGKHDVLAPRAPQGAQGGQPTGRKFVRRVKHLAGFQLVASVFNRLFFPVYSGSGLLSWCWGRLSPMPACFSARRPVSSETRMPVLSAR
jgi:hypothetical protein